MNALKKFITQNKALVIMTCSVTMGIFLIFTVIAVAISGTPSSAPEEKPSVSDTQTTGQNVADGSTESQTVTIPQYSGEESSCGSEEDTTEEPTTEPPVDPYTLPYKIMVNRAANCITVYAKDEAGEFTVPVKAITVSCGKNVGDTPLGKYQTINEYLWRKMVDGTYSQYAYRIVGPILFHSVPYYTQNKNDLEWEEFNKLGTPASLGCVRMTVADAKWLMDNCPIGTLVDIYDDANNPGPLGKPETIKIPATAPDELKKWDPTDPDPANPWKAHFASITHPASLEVKVKVGAAIEEVLSHFTAKDTCGNDITSKIKITGTVDLMTPGTYSVLVQVQDAIGSRAEVGINVIVETTETSSESDSSVNDGTSSTDNESSSDGTSSTDNESSNDATSSEEQTTSKEPASSEEQTTSKEPASSEEQTTSKEPASSEEQTTSKEPASSEEQTTPNEAVSSDENTSKQDVSDSTKQTETTLADSE